MSPNLVIQFVVILEKEDNKNQNITENYYYFRLYLEMY